MPQVLVKERNILLLLLAFCLLFGITGLAIFLKNLYFINTATLTSGTVISFQHDEQNNISSNKPIVEFEAQGKKYTFASNTHVSIYDASHNNVSDSLLQPTYYSGEQVSVFYNPNNPADAKINTFSTLWLLSIMNGVMFIVLASICFNKFMRIRKKV